MISYASSLGLVAYLIKRFKSWECKIYMNHVRLIICNTIIVISFIFSKVSYSEEVLTIPMDSLNGHMREINSNATCCNQIMTMGSFIS